MRYILEEVAITYLGQKLVDDTVANSSTVLRRPTLLANCIQLIEDDDVQTALIALGLVLGGDTLRQQPPE